MCDASVETRYPLPLQHSCTYLESGRYRRSVRRTFHCPLQLLRHLSWKGYIRHGNTRRQGKEAAVRSAGFRFSLSGPHQSRLHAARHKTFFRQRRACSTSHAAETTKKRFSTKPKKKKKTRQTEWNPRTYFATAVFQFFKLVGVRAKPKQ